MEDLAAPTATGNLAALAGGKLFPLELEVELVLPRFADLRGEGRFVIVARRDGEKPLPESHS